MVSESVTGDIIFAPHCRNVTRWLSLINHSYNNNASSANHKKPSYSRDNPACHFLILPFYPRDAIRKRGLCCRNVSGCLSHANIVSKQLNHSLKFFHHLVALSFLFLTSFADTQFQG